VLLVQAIRKAVDQTSGGHDDTSYRRPSRRPSVGGVIRPSRVALVPRILVIVDSSGSMDERDLGFALGLIAKVLSGFRLRDGVQVMVGDSAVQSCDKVFDPKRMKITGGGGTEMDRLIVAGAELHPRPQLIVVATDGITGWPHEPVGIPVVACLTRDTTRCRVPSWIKTIVLA
jgi:predicted metal-dependent peptidase